MLIFILFSLPIFHCCCLFVEVVPTHCYVFITGSIYWCDTRVRSHPAHTHLPLVAGFAAYKGRSLIGPIAVTCPSSLLGTAPLSSSPAAKPATTPPPQFLQTGFCCTALNSQIFVKAFIDFDAFPNHQDWVPNHYHICNRDLILALTLKSVFNKVCPKCQHKLKLL